MKFYTICFELFENQVEKIEFVCEVSEVFMF